MHLLSCLSTTGHVCLYMQILRSCNVCCLKFHTERLCFPPHSNRRTLPKPCPSDKRFSFFWVRHIRGIFSLEHFYAVARQRFFKAGPGDQIMTNEVQVNVTRGGSWREIGPGLNLYREISSWARLRDKPTGSTSLTDARSRLPRMSYSDL